MKYKVLIGCLLLLLLGMFVRCDYEGTLVEYPEQVEKPVADTTKNNADK